MTIIICVAVVVISYILGSIPFGLLIGKLSARTDIRQTGSGRTGATNVLRTAGKKAAALSLILDIVKGALAVLIARWLFDWAQPMVGDVSPSWMPGSAHALAALMVMAGHNWSVFLKFKGGRGVATFLGGLLALAWPAAIFGGLVMILVAGLSRYMSLGSITEPSPLSLY